VSASRSQSALYVAMGPGFMPLYLGASGSERRREAATRCRRLHTDDRRWPCDDVF